MIKPSGWTLLLFIQYVLVLRKKKKNGKQISACSSYIYVAVVAAQIMELNV
jgi:hypothetical protein